MCAFVDGVVTEVAEEDIPQTLVNRLQEEK